MLILVAVTVNYANENGGLFKTARTAKQDTAYRAEEETLLTYIYGDGVYDASTGKIDLLKLKELLEANSSKWGNITLDSNENPTTLTVTGVQSGKTHTINADGTINEEIVEIDYYDILKRYFLGADGTGRKLEEILASDDMIWLDDAETEINEGELNIQILAGVGDNAFIKCYNALYELSVNVVEDPEHPGDSTYAFEKTTNFKLVYKQNLSSREGKDLGEITGETRYNGWTILYDYGSYVEAVSPSPMGELQLGSTSYQSGDTEEANTAYDEAIASYDNAIDTINNYCKTLSNLPTNSGVRSVGAETDTTTTYVNLDPLNNGWANNRGFEIKNRGKATDDFYVNDVGRMIYYSVLVKENEEKYWIASRFVDVDSSELQLNVLRAYYDWEYRVRCRW